MKKLIALALFALAYTSTQAGDWSLPDWMHPGKANAEASAQSAKSAASAAGSANMSSQQSKSNLDQTAAERKKAEEAANRAEKAEKHVEALEKKVATETKRPDLGQASPASGPGALKSMQPFEHFALGEGEGYAREYKSRSKAQFVALLRDKELAKKEMRVSCEQIVRQMAEGRKALPFEGCEGAAAAIEHDDSFSVVDCKDEMFLRDNWLAVTNKSGSAFGVWHRKCLPHEQVLVYNGAPLISLTCLNTALPDVPVAPPANPPATATLAPVPAFVGGCPDVYHLKVYNWERKALSLPGVAETAAKEEEERTFDHKRFEAPHVSRNHYDQFKQANAAGTIRHSVNLHTFRVSLIMTPEAQGGPPTITKEEVLGGLTVQGWYSEISLRLAQLQQWDAIRVVAVDGEDFVSPPRYPVTGLREMRFFNHLPGTKLGEWDSNPDPDCVMGEAWIER